jgi:hypothetical protein
MGVFNGKCFLEVLECRVECSKNKKKIKKPPEIEE